jgi:glycosyltransferase involved in cell wall biosynthesis
MKISVIIITLNERNQLPITVEAIHKAAKIHSPHNISIEIIVSDGGSTDGTVEYAKLIVDQVIQSPKGRSNQLNNGIKVANGEVILFLHADTILHPTSFQRIIHAFQDSIIIGGGFTKEWNWDTHVEKSSFLNFLLYFWTGLGNWLVKLFKIFPGDNAIFLRKSIINSIGDYSPFWICEDMDFSLRLKKYAKTHHDKIICIPFAVRTSARRFEQNGLLKTVNWWIWMFFLWRFGWSQEKMRVFFNKYSLGHNSPLKSYVLL